MARPAASADTRAAARSKRCMSLLGDEGGFALSSRWTGRGPHCTTVATAGRAIRADRKRPLMDYGRLTRGCRQAEANPGAPSGFRQPDAAPVGLDDRP